MSLRVGVIGDGVAGLGVAWRLAQRGQRVTVFGTGGEASASVAAAGMLAPHAEFAGPEDTLAPVARMARGLWRGFAEEVERASGGAIGFVESGTFVVARGGADMVALRARYRDAGDDVEWLDGDEARRREPALERRIAGAAFLRGDAHVNNRRLVAQLAVAAERAGVIVRRAREGASVAVLRDAVTNIIFDGGRFPCDAVVIAAGAWSGAVAGLPAEVQVPVRPVKGQMLAVSQGARGLRHMVWGDGVYVVPRAGLPLAIGATMEEVGFDTSIGEPRLQHLLDSARAVAPAAIGEAVVERWCGFRPGTPDDLPVLGAGALKGLYYATGQFRNGILLAPFVADTVAAAVATGVAPDMLAPFSPLRFTKG